MAATPTALGDKAEELLTAVVLALEEAGRTVSKSYVAHGAPAWDTCEADQVAVYAEPLGMRSNRCMLQLNPTLHVQVIRCAPTLRNDGSAPSASALHESGRGFLDEILAVIYAVQGSGIFGNCDGVEWGTAVPLGPSGGAAGWDWPISFKL